MDTDRNVSKKRKTPEKGHNEMAISNLPDKEFKITAIKIQRSGEEWMCRASTSTKNRS